MRVPYLILAAIVVAAVIASGVYIATRPLAPAPPTPAPTPITVKFGAGGIGMTMYVQQAAIASILGTEYGWDTKLIITGGLTDSAYKLGLGEVDIALTTLYDIHNALKGLEFFEGKKMPPVYRGIVLASPFLHHVVTTKPLKSYDDLGKASAISTLTKCSVSSHTTDAILAAKGWKIPVHYLPAMAMTDRLYEGKVDAVMGMLGPPHPAVTSVAAKTKIYLYSLKPEEKEELLKLIPTSAPGIIKAGTYTGVDYDVETVGIYGILTVHKDMPEDIAYNITKAIIKNWGKLPEFHAGFKEWSYSKESLEYIDKLIGLHPGAKKYYKEIGVL